MNLKENEYLVGDAVIEIAEHESYYGKNPEPEYFDLKLTIKDGENEIVVIGMDDEMERFAKAILEALKAKQQRQAEQDEEEHQESLRQWLPKKAFCLSGYDVWKGLAECEVGDDFTELEDGTIKVMLPDDAESVELLNWLSQAYCVEWKAVKK